MIHELKDDLTGEIIRLIPKRRRKQKSPEEEHPYLSAAHSRLLKGSIQDILKSYEHEKEEILGSNSKKNKEDQRFLRLMLDKKEDGGGKLSVHDALTNLKLEYNTLLSMMHGTHKTIEELEEDTKFDLLLEHLSESTKKHLKEIDQELARFNDEVKKKKYTKRT